MARTMDEVLNRYYESWLGLDAVYEKWAARRGVTFNMLNILTLLDDEGVPLAQAELCRRLHLSKQTVASVIDGLEKRGLAARHVSKEDRRSRVVRLTEEGRAFAREISTALRRFERRSLSMLSEEERTALVDTTYKLWRSMADELEREENAGCAQWPRADTGSSD